MSDKLKAVDDIKKLSRLFKGIIDLGEDLATLGSLEQAIQEVKGRLDGYKADEKALVNKYAIMQAEANSAVLAAQELRIKIDCDAEKVRSAAQAQVNAIIEQAKGEALVIAMDAAKLQAVAAADVRNLIGDKAVLQKEIAEAQAKLDELTGKIDALKAKFA